MTLPMSKWKSLTILSIIAGILYSSWPLGPLLNPAVARRGQASELAVPHQPYYWIFMYGDVASSLVIVYICWRLFIQYKNVIDSFRIHLTIFSIVIFCITASAAALFPVQCLSALNVCPAFTNNGITLFHAITSVLAPFTLFVALVTLWFYSRENWLFSLFIICYFTVASATLIVQFTPGSDVLISNIFITFCSIAIALIPWLFHIVYSPTFISDLD
jgi:hypothetical protein